MRTAWSAVILVSISRLALADVPRVVIAPPVVDSRGDLEVVKRYIRRDRAKFRTCYAKAPLRETRRSGLISTSFTIGANGSVTTATVTGLDPKVTACLTGAIKAIRFPRTLANVTITYPAF